MDRKEMAVNLHKSGFNCAQSVACSFCHVMGYEPETVFKLSEGFGAGMGTFNTCGAVSAMAMVIGMKESDGNLDAPKTKKELLSTDETGHRYVFGKEQIHRVQRNKGHGWRACAAQLQWMH